MTLPIPAALAEALHASPTQQQAFAWSKARWRHWLDGVGGAPEFLSALPKAVDRESTAAVVQHELTSGRIENAFVAAMVWGHGTSGYGAYRTAVVLSGQSRPEGLPADPGVVGRLAKAAELAAKPERVEAYRYLANEGKVRALGPAFYTKWLYFASATEGHHSASALPILDAVVQRFLVDTVGIRLRTGRTADYATYVELLAEWASGAGRTAVQVEEAIFRIAR